MINHINKMKDRNHTIISTNTEKAFEKIQYPFMTKIINKVCIEGTYLNIIKAIYDIPTANVTVNVKNLKVLPLRSGTRKGCPFSFIFFCFKFLFKF